MKLEEKLARERVEEKATKALEAAKTLLEVLKTIDVDKSLKEFHEKTVAPDLKQAKDALVSLKEEIVNGLNMKADVEKMAEALQLKAARKEVAEAKDELKRLVAELKTSL